VTKVIGQRSRSPDEIFRRGDTPRFALPLFCYILEMFRHCGIFVFASHFNVDSRVFTRMLRKDGRTDGSVTIFLRNFVGDGITKQSQKEEKSKTEIKLAVLPHHFLIRGSLGP
jgi:hypothetical protein